MSRRTIVFATPELEPFVSGGAGSVVAGLMSGVEELDVTAILAAPDIPASVREDPRIRSVDLREQDGSIGWYLDRSRLISEAIANEVREGNRIAIVEFTDFEATAWHTLVDRSELGLDTVSIGVRIHGPVEAITDAIGVCPPPLDLLGEMERLVLTMADFVIAPSTSMATWASDRYGIELDRVLIGHPPVPEVERREWVPAEVPTFIYFGRLTEAKGVHDLISAFGRMRGSSDARLLLIGPDGWSLEHNRPMSEVLRQLAGSETLDRIEFTGRLDRSDALDRLMSAWAVVMPSRFESFCLAAHEARRAGAPIVLPDLPAFDEFDENTGALKYDGSVSELARLLDEIAGDRSLVTELAERPAPEVGDPIAVYSTGLPPPRHPASQIALATAASDRLDSFMAQTEHKGHPARKRLLRYLPRPLVKAAARMMPQSVRERSRMRASWWEEEGRRQSIERRRAVEVRIAHGEVEDIAQPRVTVVIPCFNQGEWVADAVLSVFEQTESSWEIVLVDDGSTDQATVTALDELALWPRVRLIRQENAGLPAARNAGMRIARGEFLVPLDADDELTPTYLMEMLESLNDRPDAAYAHCWGRYFGTFDAYWVTRPFNPYQLLLSNSVLGCALIRGEAWRAVGGYDETLVEGNEDWDLWLRFLEAGWDQVAVRLPLFRYRMHGPSMSVATLAGHEHARIDMKKRHPSLYAPDVVKATKSQHYPWVTVLLSHGVDVGQQDLGDREEVVVDVQTGSLADGISRTRGKIVVEWNLLESPSPDVLRRITEAMERRTDAESASAGGVRIAWRRWALHDPDADLRGSVEVDLDVRGGATPMLSRGSVPNAEWMVDEQFPEPDLKVIRQRPEEEGPLPDWLLG